MLPALLPFSPHSLAFFQPSHVGWVGSGALPPLPTLTPAWLFLLPAAMLCMSAWSLLHSSCERASPRARRPLFACSALRSSALVSAPPRSRSYSVLRGLACAWFGFNSRPAFRFPRAACACSRSLIPFPRSPSNSRSHLSTHSSLLDRRSSSTTNVTILL